MVKILNEVNNKKAYRQTDYYALHDILIFRVKSKSVKIKNNKQKEYMPNLFDDLFTLIVSLLRMI